MQIDLKEGQLVVVVEGLHRITEGPNAGELTFGGMRIYAGKTQVSILRSFSLEAVAHEAVPRVLFNWGESLPSAAEEEESTLGNEGIDHIRAVYHRNVELVKRHVPWAGYISPLESFDPWGGKKD